MELSVNHNVTKHGPTCNVVPMVLFQKTIAVFFLVLIATPEFTSADSQKDHLFSIPLDTKELPAKDRTQPVQRLYRGMGDGVTAAIVRFNYPNIGARRRKKNTFFDKLEASYLRGFPATKEVSKSKTKIGDVLVFDLALKSDDNFVSIRTLVFRTLSIAIVARSKNKAAAMRLTDSLRPATE